MKRFIKWLDNFWYHYKWGTLLAAFFIICGVVFTLQMCHKETYDLFVVYAGPTYLDKEGHASLLSSFRQIMPEDFNDDGEKNINYNQIVYVSPERESEYAENSVEINAQFNNSAVQQFNSTMQTDQYLIYLVDETLYLQTKGNGLYQPLSEILETVPENAYDECGLLLKDLPFGSDMAGVNSLDEHTILCLRKPNVVASLWGGEEAEALYNYHVEIFRKIVEYQGPES